MITNDIETKFKQIYLNKWEHPPNSLNIIHSNELKMLRNTLTKYS